jgi:hypothetical protein
VLATGYFHVTPTALQLVMLMDDALSQACEQGQVVPCCAALLCASQPQSTRVHPT